MLVSRASRIVSTSRGRAGRRDPSALSSWLPHWSRNGGQSTITGHVCNEPDVGNDLELRATGRIG